LQEYANVKVCLELPAGKILLVLGLGRSLPAGLATERCQHGSGFYRGLGNPFSIIKFDNPNLLERVGSFGSFESLCFGLWLTA